MRISPRRLSTLLILALVAVGSLSCSSTDPEESGPSPQAEPSESPSEPGQRLVFLRGRQLVGLDLASRNEEVLGRVPAPDVFPVPGSPDRFLLVDDRGTGEDFAEDPVLSLIDETGAEQQSYGPGFGPLVDPTGSRVAFVRSVGGGGCEGEVCLVSVELRAADLDGKPRTLLPAGDWHPLSWAGEKLILSAQGRTLSLSPDGRTEELAFTADEVWGASPDGERLILSRQRGVEILDLATSEVLPTDARGLLAEGEWSPEGDELVGVIVTSGSTSLVRLTLETGAIEEIPESEGASGPILWGADGSFVYVRADGLELEAILCEPGGGCESVLRWAEGVTPLSLG